jgi:hypothetical protein
MDSPLLGVLIFPLSMIFRLLLFLLFFPLKNEYTPVLSTYDRLVIFVFHVCFVEFVLVLNMDEIFAADSCLINKF